jgi:hypothetical protein
VPPQTARTEQLSTTARDQSTWLSRASQSSNAKCIRSQTRARPANRANVANTSSPNRSPVREATSATGCRCEGRRQCRSDTRDPRRAAVRLLADGVELARTVRQDPTTHLEAVRRPYPLTLPRRQDQVSDVLLHALRTRSTRRRTAGASSSSADPTSNASTAGPDARRSSHCAPLCIIEPTAFQGTDVVVVNRLGMVLKSMDANGEA